MLFIRFASLVAKVTYKWRTEGLSVKPSKALLTVLLAISLCLTISCTKSVKPDEGSPPVSPEKEKGVASRGPAVASSGDCATCVTCGTTTTCTLTGPCERVFIQHPREDLAVTQGKGQFYCPPDAVPGIPVETGFSRIVEENIAYKFVAADGDTLVFTVTS